MPNEPNGREASLPPPGRRPSPNHTKGGTAAAPQPFVSWVWRYRRAGRPVAAQVMLKVVVQVQVQVGRASHGMR